MRRSRKPTSPFQKTLRSLSRIEEASTVTSEMIEIALTKVKRGEIGASFYGYFNDEREAALAGSIVRD